MPQTTRGERIAQSFVLRSLCAPGKVTGGVLYIICRECRDIEEFACACEHDRELVHFSASIQSSCLLMDWVSITLASCDYYVLAHPRRMAHAFQGTV